MFSGESPRMWCPTVVSASDVTQHLNKVFQNLILMVSFDIVFYTQIMFGPANVKVEKDSIIQLCTPGVIKKENVGGTNYCQMGLHSTPINICGVTTSSGQSFLFGAGPSTAALSQQKDQKPIFNVYTPLTSSEDSWSRGKGFGNASGMQQRASECFSKNYTSPYAR